tara:strand:+ start:68 stop:307 length:240 start_codon:yes stop_codon:yes gene_type:complete
MKVNHSDHLSIKCKLKKFSGVMIGALLGTSFSKPMKFIMLKMFRKFLTGGKLNLFLSAMKKSMMLGPLKTINFSEIGEF